MKRHWCMAIALGVSIGAAAMSRQSASGGRSLRTSSRFVDTTVGFWRMCEQPQLIREPTLADLARADPHGASADFGLSFNCAVKAGGGMTDCRPIYASPDSADKAALTRALAPHVRLSRASAGLAREKAYRLTIDVALDTTDRYGMIKECRPPFCMLEGAMPPPPPPSVRDPVMAAALDRARTCFDAAWRRSGELRFAAEKALRDRAGRPATDDDRKLVLDYVNSRHALAACAAKLRETARVLPLDAGDARAVAAAVDAMRMGYDGQTRYELAILIGYLDPAAGRAEESLP